MRASASGCKAGLHTPSRRGSEDRAEAGARARGGPAHTARVAGARFRACVCDVVRIRRVVRISRFHTLNNPIHFSAVHGSRVRRVSDVTHCGGCACFTGGGGGASRARRGGGGPEARRYRQTGRWAPSVTQLELRGLCCQAHSECCGLRARRAGARWRSQGITSPAWPRATPNRPCTRPQMAEAPALLPSPQLPQGH